MIKDYYSILEVDRKADADTIKKSYRKLANQWHPDKHQEKEKKNEAEEKFKEISEAYSVLSDTEKKSNYDMTGSPNQTNPFGFRTTGTPFDIIFNNMHRQSRPSQPHPMKGQSIQLSLEVSLYEALFGVVKTISYSTVSACGKCNGRGGVEFDTCPECQGRGMKIRQQPNVIMQTTCDRCKGEGSSIKTPCGDCNTQGIVHEERKFNVAIPEKILHKTVLKLAGQGGRGFNGGPSGDVLVQVSVKYPDMSSITDEEKGVLENFLTK